MSFGAIMQNGYLVEDLESAALHWVTTLGVGPFFFMQHIDFAECYYRGKHAEIDLSVAIAYAGDIQIELIQQHDESPSIYQAFGSKHGTGLQHVGAIVDDLDQALADNQAEHLKEQWGITSTGMRFAYLNTDFHPGGMIELIESTPEMIQAFTYMKSAADDWDGSKPLRGRTIED